MSGCVLVTGARAPVALEVARSFAALGWRVHLADSVPATAARWSRLGAPVHRLPPPRTNFAQFRDHLAALALRTGADLIVPTCEEVFYVAAAEPGVPVFAPPLATLRDLHSKARFIDLARQTGLDVPETRLVTDPGAEAAASISVRCRIPPDVPDNCAITPTSGKAAHSASAQQAIR